MPEFQIDENAVVLVEFGVEPGVQQTALSAKDLAKKSAEALDASMNTINQMARRVTSAVNALAKPPTEVEVAFGIQLKAEAGALIAKAAAGATLDVKLTWKSVS